MFDAKVIFFILFFIWSFPVWKYRSDFRMMVYETRAWKINIQPRFWRELKVLFGFEKRSNPTELKTIQFYRFYLVMYFILLAAFLAV